MAIRVDSGHPNWAREHPSLEIQPATRPEAGPFGLLGSVVSRPFVTA